MPTFRLLQISDLHFYRTPRTVGIPDNLRRIQQNRRRYATVSSHDPDIAEAVIRFTESNREFDAVIVTGDLATTGAIADLQIANQFLQRLPTQTSRGQNIGLGVIPGNHDRFIDQWVPSVYPPGEVNFDQIFHSQWSVGQGVQILTTSSRRGENLFIIGADFCLSPGDTNPLNRNRLGVLLNRFDHLGRGRVYPQVIDDLVQYTDQIKKHTPEAVIVWAIHFEPEAADSDLELVDQTRLRQAVAQSSPHAIICGHTHLKSRQKSFFGCPVICCGTTTQYYSVDGYFFNIIEFEAMPGVAPVLRLRPFQYDGQTQTFEEI